MEIHKVACSAYYKSIYVSGSKNNKNEPRIWGEGKEQKWKSERRQLSTEICPTRTSVRVAYSVTTFSSTLHFGKESNKYIHIIIQEKLVIGDVAETKRSPALPKQIFILRGTLTSRPLS